MDLTFASWLAMQGVRHAWSEGAALLAVSVFVGEERVAAQAQVCVKEVIPVRSHHCSCEGRTSRGSSRRGTCQGSDCSLSMLTFRLGCIGPRFRSPFASKQTSLLKLTFGMDWPLLLLAMGERCGEVEGKTSPFRLTFSAKGGANQGFMSEKWEDLACWP